MTQISSECSEEKAQAINEVAAKQLAMLFPDLYEAIHHKDLLEQYEIDFLGDLYARMVMAAYMGYCPDLMGADAIEAKDRLVKLAEEHENDTDKERSDDD